MWLALDTLGVIPRQSEVVDVYGAVELGLLAAQTATAAIALHAGSKRLVRRHP